MLCPFALLCTSKTPSEIKERTAKQNMRLEEHFSKLRNHEEIKKIWAVVTGIEFKYWLFKLEESQKMWWNTASFLKASAFWQWNSSKGEKATEVFSWEKWIVLVTVFFWKKLVQESPYYTWEVCNRFLNRRSVIQKKSSLYLTKILWILLKHMIDIFIFAKLVPEK